MDDIFFGGADDLDFLRDDYSPIRDKDTPKKEKDEEAPKQVVATHRGGKRQLTWKASSELALEKQLDWYFQPGDCLIESSANVNTNPRSENTVLTVDRELVNHYVQLFAEIVPFNKDFGAEPYKIQEESGSA